MTTSTSDGPNAAPARALLLDAFARIDGLVRGLTSGASRQQLLYRPDPEANTIAWLVWHLARTQDDHVADAARMKQVWVAGDWDQRFALPFDAAATGYGHTAADVAAVDVEPDLLAGYHHDVHRMTVRYLETVDAAELDRIVDAGWDPPVTVGVRLVSVIGDCMQHLGQAAYVRGLAERAV